MTTSSRNKTHLTLPSDREIKVTRSFEAPRDIIWRMWTRAEHLKNWWGPKHWSLPTCEMDFRVGGTWFYCMQGPDGMQACGKAIYLEIDEPKKIVYEDYFVDSGGNLVEGMPEAKVTNEFREDGERTTVISVTQYRTKEDRDKVIEMGVEAGIGQTFDRLEAYLPDFL